MDTTTDFAPLIKVFGDNDDLFFPFADNLLGKDPAAGLQNLRLAINRSGFDFTPFPAPAASLSLVGGPQADELDELEALMKAATALPYTTYCGLIQAHDNKELIGDTSTANGKFITAVCNAFPRLLAAARSAATPGVGVASAIIARDKDYVNGLRGDVKKEMEAVDLHGTFTPPFVARLKGLLLRYDELVAALSPSGSSVGGENDAWEPIGNPVDGWGNWPKQGADVELINWHNKRRAFGSLDYTEGPSEAYWYLENGADAADFTDFTHWRYVTPLHAAPTVSAPTTKEGKEGRDQVNTFCQKAGHACTDTMCDNNGCAHRPRPITESADAPGEGVPHD